LKLFGTPVLFFEKTRILLEVHSMKKKLTAFLLLLLSAAVLASCLDGEGTTPPETETITPETAPVVLELTAAEEEEITALFNRMIEYEGYCLEPTMLTADGKMEAFNKVVDERFDTWEEWMAFVESIYTGDKLEQVIEEIEREGHFVNIDGYTHVVEFAGTSFLSKDFTMSVEEKIADTVTVKLNRIEHIPHLEIVNEIYNVYELHKTDAGWRICK
jgi:hypothetical protein